MQHSSSQQQDQSQQQAVLILVLFLLHTQIYIYVYVWKNNFGFYNQPERLLMVLQHNRKRKQHSSSGAANSTSTGNRVGPSPNSPPSTHTPGDGMTTASSAQHVNNVQKSLMMNGPEETVGLATCSNLLVTF